MHLAGAGYHAPARNSMRDHSPFAEGSWSERELLKQYLDMDFVFFMLFIILHSTKWVACVACVDLPKLCENAGA